ncbi:glycosyltransferase family 2 protein [Nesterenkonia flava]|uniref:Glycosyltransferase family 2 protein n=1 Tax=Nesterenkonia flava TaxID=469799 RepID=A0ABU1FRQ5_9MICC|nr:glycosyltransferase family 2 protein [Nesterenkonia flava]MDR5711336.1 glycosyltransferase family 2 protein [Nesterenkonia flava]
MIHYPGDDLASINAEARVAVADQHLQLAVILPVFNNGDLLRERSFASLRRFPQFSRLHVLLIDDGSTDPDTVATVRELAQAYPNVTAFLHRTGGSGSASRPRNVGLALTHTPYVTYLDPDDEAHDDVLWRAHEALAQAPEAQLAITNQLRAGSEGWQDVNNIRHYDLHPLEGRADLYRAGPQVLTQAQFRQTNLAALVIRTEWLKSTGIEQVLGAAGQDSLFFLQVFAAAETFLAHREPAYLYHADTPGSMVNAVGARYFAKCVIRERAQAQWLKESSLLEAYVRQGLERALVTWYLRKLKQVPGDDGGFQRAECAQLIREIASLYVGDPSRHRWRYPQTMLFFRRPGLPSAQGLRAAAASVRAALSS